MKKDELKANRSNPKKNPKCTIFFAVYYKIGAENNGTTLKLRNRSVRNYRKAQQPHKSNYKCNLHTIRITDMNYLRVDLVIVYLLRF